jgi:hypothetical protein
VENEMKINAGKIKALSFMRAWVKDPLNYSFKDQRIPQASCCKYVGIIIQSVLSWAAQVNYMVQKAWKALHFIMHILKKGNNNMKSSTYTSLICSILEYGAEYWDPYRECQINALDSVQKKVAKFAHHRSSLVWESLAQPRKIARICALFKVYTGQWVWKAIGDRLQAPSYLSRLNVIIKLEPGNEQILGNIPL